MKNLIIAVASFGVLSACSGETEQVDEPVETLESYSALGTEPGWSVELKEETVDFTAMDGPEFSLPISRMDRTETGWTIKGFDGDNNINLTITLDEKCNDGMSDREYADTVQVSVGGFGNQSGCGGEILAGPDDAP